MNDPNLQKALGDEIRRRRAALGMSQEALAGLARVHRTYIGSVERGERNISLANIVGIAAALGCRSSELLADAEVASGVVSERGSNRAGRTTPTRKRGAL